MNCSCAVSLIIELQQESYTKSFFFTYFKILCFLNLAATMANEGSEQKGQLFNSK